MCVLHPLHHSYLVTSTRHWISSLDCYLTLQQLEFRSYVVKIGTETHRVVVVELEPFMPPRRGWCVPSQHGSWGRRRACLAGAVAWGMVLLALPCLVVQHTHAPNAVVSLASRAISHKKTNESLTLDSGPDQQG